MADFGTPQSAKRALSTPIPQGAPGLSELKARLLRIQEGLVRVESQTSDPKAVQDGLREAIELSDELADEMGRR